MYRYQRCMRTHCPTHRPLGLRASLPGVVLFWQEDGVESAVTVRCWNALRAVVANNNHRDGVDHPLRTYDVNEYSMAPRAAHSAPGASGDYLYALTIAPHVRQPVVTTSNTYCLHCG